MSEIYKCSKCLELLPKSEFHLDTRLENGIKTICKKCANAHSKFYREYLKENAIKARKNFEEKYGKNGLL